MVTPAETQTRKPLLGHQQTMASRVIAETVGELAKQGIEGDHLRIRAIGLAEALNVGLGQITFSGSCSTRSVSHEHQ